MKKDGFKSVYKKLIHNNEESDIGINSDIYMNGNNVNVSSESKLGRKYWQLRLKDIDNVDGFYNYSHEPDSVTFNVSYSLAEISTEIMTETLLGDVNLPVGYQKPSYDLRTSVLTEVEFSGRLLNQHLVLSYAESQLDKNLTETEAVISKKSVVI